jgi:hypothetical protein
MIPGANSSDEFESITRITGIVVALCIAKFSKQEVNYMAEEHEATHPYKCAICGAKFDSQDQLQNHLKSCTQKKN